MQHHPITLNVAPASDLVKQPQLLELHIVKGSKIEFLETLSEVA